MTPCQTVVLVALVLLVRATPAAPQVAVTTCGQVVVGSAYLANDLECGPDGYGVVLRGRLDLRGHMISGATYGIFCGRYCEPLDCVSGCTVLGGTISESYLAGIQARRVVLENVTVTGHATYGVLAHRAIVRQSTVSGNAAEGIRGGRVVLEGTTVQQNGTTGIVAGRAKLRESTVTGNALDLDTVWPPKLIDSTCDTSNQGVCTLDP